MADPKGYSRQDRDLLVTLTEQVKQVRADILDLKDNTKSTILDHETRIRRLELWGAIAIGFSYALQFYLNYVHK